MMSVWVSSVAVDAIQDAEKFYHSKFSYSTLATIWIYVKKILITGDSIPSRLTVVSRGAKKKQAYETNQWVIYR